MWADGAAVVNGRLNLRGALVAALALMVVVAWNDVFTATIRDIFPRPAGQAARPLFVYAVVVTAAVGAALYAAQHTAERVADQASRWRGDE